MVSYTIPHSFPIGNAGDAPRRSAGLARVTSGASASEAAATRWLIGQGIRVMGADAWGWDRPFWATREEFARTGEAACLWEAHRVGMDLEYCHIEKLANLRAGWSRVVAIFP
jgi:hypothetical protein